MGEALSFPEGPEGQAQDVGAGSAQESVLLSQLIQLLHQRSGHSLLLSDLGALLPTVLRQRVKDQGGLRSWLQRYPSLFSIVGQPGKECVTLCLGAAMQHLQTGSTPPAAEAQVFVPDASCRVPPEVQPVMNMANPDNEEGFEEDIDALSSVQLRGLPYRATVEDIVTFLGEHSSDLSESNAVQLVQNRDGRPSGFARVQFNCPESAKRCVGDLHLRSMDDRYVEVFLYSERPSKGRQRRGGVEDGTAAVGDPYRLQAAVEFSGVTREQVVKECRMQMSDIKQRRLLLSMLGVALSPGARSYLKQMDQGLKHFLSQFPNEFSVDGGKGCEYVTYNPTQLNLSQAIDGFDGGVAADAYGRAVGSTMDAYEHGGPTASPKSMAAAAIASSPAHEPASAQLGPATPSDWGTPSIPQWPGQPQPWVPPWPQGAPGGPPADPNGWGALPAWPMPQNQFQGWPAWPGYGPPPWGGMPPNIEVGPGASPADVEAAAAAAAAFGVSPTSAPQQAGMQQQANIQKGEMRQPTSCGEVVAGIQLAGMTGSAVRLRGLPFTSVEQDVLAFFAQHDIVDRIDDGPKAVNILTRSNGRPSGQAIVQMREPTDAELAQSVLHGQWMGSRYIEVFLLTAEESEAQNAKQEQDPSPARRGQQEPMSLSMGVPPMQAPPSSMPQLPPLPTVPSVPVPAGHAGAAQDMNNPYAQGMTPAMPPPWQLNMWSAAMASGGGMPGAPPPDFGGGQHGGPGVEGSSWEALFEFLGPESAAAMANGMPQPPMDFAAMGYGMPGGMHAFPPPVMPAGPQQGMPPANGAPAAAAV